MPSNRSALMMIMKQRSWTMIHHFPFSMVSSCMNTFRRARFAHACSCGPSIYIEMRNMPKSPLCECSGQVSVTHFQPLQSYCPLFWPSIFYFFWLIGVLLYTHFIKPASPPPEVTGPQDKKVDILTIFDEGMSPRHACSWHALPVLPCSGSWASEGDVDGSINKSFKITIIDFDGGERWHIIAVDEQSNPFSRTWLSRFTCIITDSA